MTLLNYQLLDRERIEMSAYNTGTLITFQTNKAKKIALLFRTE